MNLRSKNPVFQSNFGPFFLQKVGISRIQGKNWKIITTQNFVTVARSWVLQKNKTRKTCARYYLYHTVKKLFPLYLQIIIPIISICNFATLCRAILVLIQLSSFNDEFLVVNFGMKNAYWTYIKPPIFCVSKYQPIIIIFSPFKI